MSLSFQLTEIEDWKELWLPSSVEAMRNDYINDFRHDTETDEVTMLNPVTKALIFRTIAVGIGEITDKTAKEFYARSVIFERLFNSFLVWRWNEDLNRNENIGISPHHVWRHVGLSTNVSYETWAKWRNRMLDQLHGELQYDYDKTDFACPPDDIGI